jgi:hypothetical protein
VVIKGKGRFHILLPSTASPGPAKQFIAADYIPWGAAVATLKGVFWPTLADFPGHMLVRRRSGSGPASIFKKTLHVPNGIEWGEFCDNNFSVPSRRLALVYCH